MKTSIYQEFEYLKSIFDSILDDIIILDTNYTIIDANKTFCEKYGISKEDAIGNKCYKLTHGLNTICKQPECKCPVEDVLISGKFSESTHLHYIDDDESYIELLAYPIKANDGTIKNIVKIGRDITERRKIGNKIKESEEKYREAYNRAEFYKDLFAHDISNILQHILSAMELSNLLINNPENLKDIQANLNIIKDQVNRGAKLISNVRKLSQLEEYKKSITPIEIMNTIKNTIEFIRDSYQEREIDIQVDSISNEVYIQANDLIQDVFENILINAVKHNINSKVKISVRFSKEVFEKIQSLKIEFVDNGVGIEDARKDKIFQRANNEDKSVRGMGLGLSLVKKMINSFNGKIWVEDKVKNDYSKGSNFIIILPEER